MNKKKLYYWSSGNRHIIFRFIKFERVKSRTYPKGYTKWIVGETIYDDYIGVGRAFNKHDVRFIEKDESEFMVFNNTKDILDILMVAKL